MKDMVETFNFHQSKLERLDIQDLFFCQKSPVDVFVYNGQYKKIKSHNDKLDKEFFLNLIKNKQSSIFVYQSEIYRIYCQIFSEVTLLARGIAKSSYLDYSKKITHYLFTQQKHLLLKPLEDKLIENQMTTFKIWLSFIKKLTINQFQEVIKNIHESPYLIQYKKNIVSATFLYRLISNENLFSENYCLNLAYSCLFSEIGASLLSHKKNIDSDKTKDKVYKYTGLILSLKTNLPPQHIQIIEKGLNLNEAKAINLISGQETYFFISAFYLCDRVMKNKQISIKEELISLKKVLPNEYQGEFKNVIARSIEFFGKTKVPD